MGKTTAPLIHKQHSQIVAAVGFQCPGHSVGCVAHFLGNGADALAGSLSDVLMSVQCFADSGYGNIADIGDIFQRGHQQASFPQIM